MSNAVIAQLESQSLTQEEIAGLRDFIASAPDSNLALLLESILVALNEGQTINVLADDAEVSPNEAAKLLKMSRPHLLKFMRDGDLPFHMVGSHQRIKMSDLRNFMQARDAGARILAEALHGNNTSADPLQEPFTHEEMDELKDL